MMKVLYYLMKKIKAKKSIAKRPNELYEPLIESIQNMSDSFEIVDFKWRYKYINRNAEKLLGYKKSYLLGKNIFKVFPHMKKTFYPKAKKAIETNKPIKYEYYSERRSKWFEVRIYPLSNGISFYFTDISARKRAEFRQEFISKINSAIAFSLDYNIALQNVAKVIVNYLADYCRIVILEEDGKVKEINADRTNGKKINLMENANHDVNQIIKKGKPEIISKVGKKNVKEYMGVPLIVKGNTIGAITLYSTMPTFIYGKDALALVGGVASRIALAIENMRLFEKVKKEREGMEFSQNVGKIGTFEWDIENNRSTWTQGFSALFGNPPNSSLGSIDKWLSFVHPEEREMLKTVGEKAIREGDKLNVRFRVIWPDKSIHYLATMSSIFRNAQNRAIRMNGVLIDITHRKNIENNLKFLAEASKVLSSSLDYKVTLDAVAKLAVPDIADWCAVDMIDKDGKIERISVAHKDPEKVKWAKKLHRKNPPDMNDPHGLPNVLKTGISELIPLITDELIRKIAKSKKQYDLIRSLGLHSVMIAPIVNQKKIIGAITFVTTKESNRQYSQEDLDIAEKLTNRVALVIENTILYQKSQQATKLRDTFISIASHELKTPITSLKVYTQVLLQQAQKQGDTDMTRYLLKMDQQVEKMNKLIRDLLDVSRMQLGKLTFRKEFFDMDELVKEVADAIQLTTKNHIISINGKAGRVFGDKDRMEQVLINLLINAIKYSPEANRVTINLSKLGKKIVVNVKDYGIGIDKKNQEKIFERFYQVDDSPTASFSGLGIGLYISTEIVKRHGGNLWVESTKGKGSTFSFAIPLKNNFL